MKPQNRPRPKSRKANPCACVTDHVLDGKETAATQELSNHLGGSFQNAGPYIPFGFGLRGFTERP